ncbi:MAG: tetratricopeptide repeat protein [Candidatus Melainabacteria bacterium]|nr:tetratricopeptide repeat protein [Candidatus Melainabacteria bacterium]
MTSERDGNEAAWKGLFSWATLILVICAAAFWFTIVKPDELRLYPGEGLLPGTVNNTQEALYLSSQKLLTDVYDMEPSRLMREGDVDGALGAARQLLDKDKWNVKNLMCAGNVFVDAPKDRGETEEGFDLLKTATYMCPVSKYVRLNYARALGRAGRIEEATKQYDQVIKSNMDFEPSLELARLYMTNLDEDKAISLLKLISEKDPENSSIQMLLGIAMARNHKEKEGFEEYIQAFAKARTLGYPLEVKELVEKNHDSVNDAIKEQRTIADQKPVSIVAKLLLAEMLILQNRIPEAKTVLDSQKTQFKDNAELHRLYAEIYHSEEKEDQAFQEWLTANTLEKKSDESAESKPEEKKAVESSESKTEESVDQKEPSPASSTKQPDTSDKKATDADKKPAATTETKSSQSEKPAATESKASESAEQKPTSTSSDSVEKKSP